MQNDPIRATGEALTSRAAVDPLLTLVRAVQAEAEAINADEDRSDDHYARLYRQLIEATPECWTAEGAREALRFVADEMEHCTGGSLSALLAAVLDYTRRVA